jgi:hypothetical protein
MTEYQPGDVVNGHVFTGTDGCRFAFELRPRRDAWLRRHRAAVDGNTQGLTGSSWQPGTGAFYDGKRW